MCPSDDEFKEYFETNFNLPGNIRLTDYDFSTDVSIPLLDDPINPLEVQQQMIQLKPNKASGPDGVSPGILKLLPIHWIMYLSAIFNNIFISGTYPLAWTRAKLVTIFKKGDNEDVRNYRGISIINSMAKVYDMVLCSRLRQWFRPFREQAGAQEKRGCLENIVALRLLCDMAKRKKFTLFVTFIDFSQAYDRVPRHKLFHVLRRLGCGSVMLCALIAMYSVTESLIGTAVVLITLGVRQGSPTSCLLFIILVDDLIRVIKEGCGRDGFLQWLHILVLMDDTVLLSTTRANMMRKMCLLKDYCTEYEMQVNQSKTKFFVIGGREGDREPLVVGDLVVEHCDTYVYLGSPFTSDGSATSAVRVHANSKMSHVLKFVSFVTKNNDIPFVIKKRVFDAALMSSLIYGCESWIGADLKSMVKLYNWCLKRLLGVRKLTCNDVCFVESGYPPFKDLIKYRQHKFFHSMWQKRSQYDDDPLAFTIKITIDSNTPTSRTVREMVFTDVSDLCVSMQKVRDDILNSNSSRRTTYKDINPHLSLHCIYRDKHAVNDIHRISFTQLRVSGHSLACETGRWNQRDRGRLEVNERLCVCGSIQTEKHVVQDCHLTQHIRDHYQFSTLDQLFNDNHLSLGNMCKAIHDILSTYH